MASHGSSAALVIIRSTAQSFAACANEVFDSSRLTAFAVTDPTEVQQCTFILVRLNSNLLQGLNETKAKACSGI